MRVLLDVVAPLRCVACGSVSDGDLCASCAHDVAVITDPKCARCGAPATCPAVRCAGCSGMLGFAKARSLVAFAEPARRLTLVLKRHGRPALARAVGGLLARLAIAEGLVDETTTVTYVPSGRRAHRVGFDHAELIARATARELHRRLRPLLMRANEGPRQADVPLAQRRLNVQGRFEAFGVDGHVLLVDDVFTTGATAEACALAIMRAGASGVDVVTWARTLRRHR